MQILLIEDEKNSEMAVRLMLTAEGFTVSSANMAYEGIALGLSGAFDVIVLDLELPDMHGHDLLTLLRNNDVETPVIILSGHSNVKIKILSFELGADDYISKPFHRDELIARIYAICRRYRPDNETNTFIGDLVLDSSSQFLHCKSKKIKLTPSEFKIFDLFIRRKREFIPDDILVEMVYGDRRKEINIKTVAVHVHNLRNKMKSIGSNICIVRDWGQGYALR